MERKETELGYSALLDCWKSLTCSLRDSGLLLYPWGDHLLNQTGPAIHRETRQARIKRHGAVLSHTAKEECISPSGALQIGINDLGSSYCQERRMLQTEGTAKCVLSRCLSLNPRVPQLVCSALSDGPNNGLILLAAFNSV